MYPPSQLRPIIPGAWVYLVYRVFLPFCNPLIPTHEDPIGKRLKHRHVFYSNPRTLSPLNPFHAFLHAFSRISRARSISRLRTSRGGRKRMDLYPHPKSRNPFSNASRTIFSLRSRVSISMASMRPIPRTFTIKGYFHWSCRSSPRK